MRTYIDAHIHLEQYGLDEIKQMLEQDESLASLISVSSDLHSCQKNLLLAKRYEKVKAAFGWHPEQSLLKEHELTELFAWMERHQQEMTAVGEVGLPYYVRQESNSYSFPMERYVEILEQFIIFAKKWNKPIVLHAIYDDAPIVCELLEKYSFQRAHFHWFKGEQKTINRMKENRYYVSVTPDIIYKERTRQLVQQYPLDRILVETDGPWPFAGPFTGKKTQPAMIHHSIKEIAAIKKLPLATVYKQLLRNTTQIYQLELCHP